MQLADILEKRLQKNFLFKIKKALKPFEKTILHPQWLSYRNQKILIDWVKALGDSDIVLDIGCANRWPEKYLSSKATYIGLDYFDTAKGMYNSDVDIYANAEHLPFMDETIDVILMFDVLEHIGNDEKAIQEVSRVLKPEGRVFVQIPFMYPIHDAPYDYRRLTKFGLKGLIERNNLNIESFGSRGKPLETAFLLTNIALAKSLLNGMNKNLLCTVLFIPFVGIISMILNCAGWFVSKTSSHDDLMPFSYHLMLKKKI